MMSLERSYRYTRALLLGLGAVLVAGCAVDKAGCDPAAVKYQGFLTKLSCDLSGSYDARAEDQQLALEQARKNRDELQQAVLDLEAQQRQVKQGLTVQKARRDRLVASLNATLDQIDQLNRDNTQLQQQVQAARQELKELESMPAGTVSASQQARIQSLRQEIETLRSMLP